MIKVGITGGIGSGKSTVCKYFEQLGIPVYYADDRAKWLMKNNLKVVEALKANFGEEVYTEAGELNRTYLANIIFNDQSKLEIVNSIVHPAVFEDGAQWQEEQAKKGVPYSMKEAALLFESGSYKSLDKIIVVTAPTDVRIQRVMKRDNTTEEAVRARMAKQLPEEEKLKKADFVIQNIDIQDLSQQIRRIHYQLTTKTNV